MCVCVSRCVSDVRLRGGWQPQAGDDVAQQRRRHRPQVSSTHNYDNKRLDFGKQYFLYWTEYVYIQVDYTS